MESWSDLPVRDRFRIKFYLDTNVLAYLVDNTYSGLTQTMSYLKESEFADLVSSRYVIFEFVGIRKKEHYLQKVLQRSTNAIGKVNISSLLKYKDSFSAPEVKFEDVQNEIKSSVETEVQEITNNFGIDYSSNLLHDSLLHPTFDINLSSKLSKEDSLVLTSAVWLNDDLKEKFVLIASNDQQFFESYDADILDPVFAQHGLTPPIIEQLRDIKLNCGTKINLTDSNDDNKIATFLPQKLKELLIKKNQDLFLGTTIHCGNSSAFDDVICFSLNSNTSLRNDIYLTIIGKELDFIYSTRLPIRSFWNQTEISEYPFFSNQAVNISFKPTDDSSGDVMPVPPNILRRLKETGNIIFINPD